MISKWGLLALPSTFNDIPPLLVNFHFGPTGYTILLTDLTHIWSETLNRRDVIRRAFQENTSIDPSEDSHQFQILLDRVRGALFGHNGTILELRHLGDRKLALVVSSPLPAPLRQLQWPLFLSPADPTLLTTEFVVPLLERYAQQARRVESLLTHLKEKDHVITKLVDKLESSSVEVSTVFLNAASLKSGKKASSWDLAGKVVKGLGPFNEQEWRHGLESSQQLEMDVEKLLRTVFTKPPSESALIKEAGKKAEATQEWWKDLHYRFVPATNNTSIVAAEEEATRRPAKPTQKSDIDSDATEDSDEEFQRQVTPPTLRDRNGYNNRSPPESSDRGQRPTKNKTTDLDAETTDEDNHDLTSFTSKRTSGPRPVDRRLGRGSSPDANDHDMRTNASNLRSLKKLGSIGGKRKLDLAGRETGPDLELQMRARASATNVGSEADKQPHKEQNLTSAEGIPPQSISTNPPRPAHRLGKIGGSKNLEDSKVLDQPTKPSSMRDSEQLQNVVDGGQNRSEGEGTLRPGDMKSSPRPDRQSAREPDAQLPAAPPAPPEGSQEAADERRAELKRQLELKSNAPVKKKKRIF